MVTAIMIALVSQLSSGPSWLDFNNGEFLIRTPKHGFKLDSEKHTLDFSVSGNPAEIDYRSRGILLRGNSATAEVVKNDDGTYSLGSADLTGSAQVNLDTAIQQEFARSRGESLKVPIATRSQLNTDSLSMRDKEGTDTLTIPAKFVLTGFRQATAVSKVAKEPFEEDSRLEGSSGKFDIARVEPQGANDLRSETIKGPGQPKSAANIYDFQSGTIEGPVHYHVVRTEHRPGKTTPAVNTYDLTADRLILDFTKPEGTITAIGHVHWKQSGDYELEDFDDKVVLTTDQDRRIQSVVGTGQPASTTYIPPASGGRR